MHNQLSSYPVLANFLSLLSEHGWCLIWAVFLVALVWAIHDTRDVLERIATSEGKAKRWAQSRFVFIWFMPLLALLAAVAAQMGSDRADSDVKRLSQSQDMLAGQVGQYSNAFADSQSQLSNAQALLIEAKQAAAAAAPKPLKDRMVDALNDIDTRIMPGLSNGVTLATGTVEESKLEHLQALCKEPGASQYLNVTLSGHSLIGTGGTEIGVNIALSPNLMQISR